MAHKVVRERILSVEDSSRRSSVSKPAAFPLRETRGVEEVEGRPLFAVPRNAYPAWTKRIAGLRVAAAFDHRFGANHFLKPGPGRRATRTACSTPKREFLSVRDGISAWQSLIHLDVGHISV